MKNFILFVSIIVLYTICPLSSYSQNDQVVKMELTEESEKTNFAKSSKAIKLNPLLFIRGDLPIYFEKNVGDNLGLEIGVGITHKDYAYDLSNKSGFLWNPDETTDIEVENKIGYSFRVGMKYYASDYSFQSEGIYFELMYRHQTYYSNLISVNDVPALNEKITRSNNDVLLLLGFVHVFEENAFIDPYLGFGIRMRSYDDITDTGNYSIGNESDVVPILSIGIKFGINL